MRIWIDQRRHVTIHATLDVPLPPDVLWGRMRQFEHFVLLDPFHASVTRVPAVAGERLPFPPAAGERLDILHYYLGVRVGRILSWREGDRFSFSDLSERGRRTGFPHVFTYRVERLADASRCVLHVHVAGRWTLRQLPNWAIRAWCWWIVQRLLQHIEHELVAAAIMRAKLARRAGGG